MINSERISYRLRFSSENENFPLDFKDYISTFLVIYELGIVVNKNILTHRNSFTIINEEMIESLKLISFKYPTFKQELLINMSTENDTGGFEFPSTLLKLLKEVECSVDFSYFFIP